MKEWHGSEDSEYIEQLDEVVAPAGAYRLAIRDGEGAKIDECGLVPPRVLLLLTPGHRVF